MKLKLNFSVTLLMSLLLMLMAEKGNSQSKELLKLEVSKQNPHYFQTEDGKPFFWLADTGWLTFGKLSREELNTYFQDRKKKGYNVIQVMVLHTLAVKNVYGDYALVDGNVSKPLTKAGNDFKNLAEYDFWDHVDYALDVAQKNGIYLAMVPVWGTNISSKDSKVTKTDVEKYAQFLADRYKNRTNVIWLNGGDTYGDKFTDIWNAIGNILKNNTNQLVTFHPFGRTDSSENYHNAKWLDFNMFQSGHRRYDQDTLPNSFKEDNYKFVLRDYALKPTKPTLDGEPSYEGIPHGLHDTLQPKWKDQDLRRYAYWSVFAGGAGFTYGNNAVMQMFHKGEKKGAYGNKAIWSDELNAPGAGQMQYVKKLILRFNFNDRIPDESMVANQGVKYNYIAATRGKDYALAYTYNGKNIILNMGVIQGDKVKASWFNPRNGKEKTIGLFANKGVQDFNPPGEKVDGNDWVLVLTSK
ncbi:glycoside hydrolase family 140 protein [Flavobacterium sp. MAHUQ-51]|uniref:glycoside hydrolase family 140 protein n=1 Tax=Flavobacterium sp. GCM10022190 TaxID=3252639 RepID=UPI003611F6B1